MSTLLVAAPLKKVSFLTPQPLTDFGSSGRDEAFGPLHSYDKMQMGFLEGLEPFSTLQALVSVVYPYRAHPLLLSDEGLLVSC